MTFGRFRDPALLWLLQRYRAQGSFPPSPQGGWSVYRTDVGLQKEEFYYDDVRATWLGKNALTLTFTAPAARTGYLDFANSLQSSATLGYILPYDMMLVGMWLYRDATGALETYRLTANGTDKAQTSFNATGDSTSYNMTLIISFSQGDVIGCRLLSGSAVGNTVAMAMFRRRNPV